MKSTKKKKAAPSKLVVAQKKPIVTVQRSLEMKLLHPSPLNPRKTLGDIRDVKDSLASVGLLQPLLVRPHPKKKGAFEIVCGHRRHAAAKELGFKEIACGVRELSDREAIEVMLVENTARADVPPLEEAEAYAALHAAPHSLPVEEIAQRVGKSAAHVYQRIRIAEKLIAPAKKALADGKILVGAALVLARLEDAGEQKKALEQMLRPGRGDAEPVSAADARWIVGGFLRVLNNAPFDVGDATMPGGACTPCPKRSDRQAALFAEADTMTAARCMDGGCWGKKAAERNRRLLKTAKDAGATIATGADANKIVPYGVSQGVTRGFVDLDRACAEDTKGRTWREIMRKAPADKLPPITVVVAEDRDGNEAVLEVTTEKAARAAARAAGVAWAQPEATKKHTPTPSKETRAGARLEQAIHAREVLEISEALEEAIAQDDVVVELLRLVLRNDESHPLRFVLPAVRRGFECDDVEKPTSAVCAAARDFVNDWIDDDARNVGELGALAFELNFEMYDEGARDFWAHTVGANLDGIEARAKKDLENQAAAKKAKRKGHGSRGHDLVDDDHEDDDAIADAAAQGEAAE